MTALSMNRMAVPFIAAVAACGVALVFAIPHVRREPPADAKVATSAPPVAKPASDAPGQAPAALGTAQAEANAMASALAGSTAPPEGSDGVPSFDVARIEPTGEAVIAGRAAPGSTVELLRNGEVHDRAIADPSGQFVMVPRPLPPGIYELTLRAHQPDGKQATSGQSVAVALEPASNEQPMVALMTPGKPARVLSQDPRSASEPASGAERVAVEAVETEPGGKLHVSGRARPGAAVRLYLNDNFVASATAGDDGRLSVTINQGVASGSYRVRLDEMAANSGAVRARAEVPFNVSDTVVAGSAPLHATPSRRPEKAAPPRLAAADATVPPAQRSLSAVVAPKITTTTVSRGESLWRISQRMLGGGQRYAVIYRANKEQIRNPNLIYPGQVFVLPTR